MNNRWIISFAFLTLNFVINNISLAHDYIPNLSAPGDKDYFVIKGDDENYIFSEDSRSFMPKAISVTQRLKKFYEKSFNFKLDEENQLLFLSDENQTPNAMATVIPHNINAYYNGGPFMMDYMSMNSWGMGILIHEMAHLYQMNPKQDVGMVTKKIFGNHPFFVWPIIPLPVFPAPNIALPTFIVEGNAVYNESLFGNGGRLFSGYSRALMNILALKNNRINPTTLTNNHQIFPFREEKYLVGGFFNLYLAEKYGLHKVNEFFYAHATHYFNPLRLNSTYENHFGSDYEKEIYHFAEKMKEQAIGFQSLDAPVLKEVLTHHPFNRYVNEQNKSEHVYFLSSLNRASPLTLFELDIKKKELRGKRTSLKGGRVFKREDGRFISSSFHQTSQKQHSIGLFNEKGRFIEESRGKAFTDIQGGHQAYFDVKSSFFDFNLYKDGSFYTTANSSAKLDKRGNIYYFKQNKKERSLYKNKTKLFSFQGFYSFITDIREEERQLYFIANSQFGSTLYRYDIDTNQISRPLASDAIIDAVALKNGEFLVAEISENGYQYKLAKASQERKISWPYNVRYDFEKEDSFHLFDNLREEKNSLPEKKYSPLLDLKYEKWSFNYINSTSSGTTTTADINFVDPLISNSLSLQYAHTSADDEDRFKIAYNNFVYPISFLINHEYKKRPLYTSNNSVALLTYPFYQKNDSTFGPKLGYFYDSKDYTNGNKESEGQIYASLNLNYHKSYPLNLYSYNSTKSAVEFLQRKRGNDFNLYASGEFNFLTHNYFTYETNYTWAKSGQFDLGENLLNHQNSIPYIGKKIYAYRFSQENPLIQGGRIGLQARSVFDTHLYFSVFPFSLHRLSPSLFWTQLNYNIDELNIKKSYHQYGVGLDFNILAFHLHDITIGMNWIKNQDDGEQTVQFQLKL